MKTFAIICCYLVAMGVAVGAPDRNNGQSPETRFKVRYHRWVAAVYDRPGTLLFSDSSAYIDFPEFDAIVELGSPALPAIVRQMEAKTDMSLFLAAAIIKITGWAANDFQSRSLQELNALLIKRLRSEKLVPEPKK